MPCPGERGPPLWGTYGGQCQGSSPTGVSSGRLNKAMFPLVLPTPLSKKWGAKLTWAREKTDRTNGHPETRRAISRQHGLMSGPSSGQAGTLLSNPSTPMFRLGSLGESPLAQACQGHGPSGALRTQAAAKLSSSISRLGPGAREVQCPGQGHTRSWGAVPCPMHPLAMPPILLPCF